MSNTTNNNTMATTRTSSTTVTSSYYVSPINSIIRELKRKNVVTAATSAAASSSTAAAAAAAASGATAGGDRVSVAEQKQYNQLDYDQQLSDPWDPTIDDTLFSGFPSSSLTSATAAAADGGGGDGDEIFYDDDDNNGYGEQSLSSTGHGSNARRAYATHSVPDSFCTCDQQQQDQQQPSSPYSSSSNRGGTGRQRRRQSWDVRYAQRRTSFGYSSPKRPLSITDEDDGGVVSRNNSNRNNSRNHAGKTRPTQRDGIRCPACGLSRPHGPQDAGRSASSFWSRNTPTLQNNGSSSTYIRSSLAESRRRRQAVVHEWLDTPRIERLEAPRHAEELLRVTPQLRVISSQSTDMNVTAATSGKNDTPQPINGLLNLLGGLTQQMNQSSPANQNNTHGKGATSSTTGATSMNTNGGNVPAGANNSPGSTTSADYSMSQERDRANYVAAVELANLLWICAHEMSLEDYGTVESETFTAIFRLVHLPNLEDMDGRMAGVMALDALIDAPSADDEKKAIKFANTLSGALRTGRGNYEFLSAVSKALGHMATSTSNVDFVESEVSRALEWIRTERSDRRLAATLVLKEFAIHAPTAFYSKTSQSTLGQGGSNEFIDYIFQAVRDPQPIVRACAADALSECIKILMERQHLSLTGLLCQVHFAVMEGFEDTMMKKNRDAIAKVARSQHGSLLVVATMIARTGDFMLPRYDEVCRKVIELTSHPKALIRLECIRLLPRLARRCPKVFARRYLDLSLDFLLESATKSLPPRTVGVDIRPSAYSSVGLLVLAMVDSSTGEVLGSPSLPTVKIMHDPERPDKDLIIELCETGAVYDRLDHIFDLVSTGLKYISATSPTRSASMHIAAFHCAADLIEALGETAKPYVSRLVDDMFEAGLSDDLINCLHAIAECIPEQEIVIEDRLFQEVSLCLAGIRSASDLCDPLYSTRFADPHSQRIVEIDNRADGSHGSRREGRTRSSTTSADGTVTIMINMSTNLTVVKSLVLSLQTLATFGDSSGKVTTFDSVVPILAFVQNVAAPYLSHPSNEVRKAAALTCCALLVPSGMLLRKVPVGSQSAVIIEDILKILLRVAVSDPSPMVRLCVVQGLDQRYDPFLCQSHHLQTLFVLLQDEVLATRAAGVRLLGRLGSFNPAPILPLMRNFLFELIVELQCGVDTGRGREDATRLLVVFLKSKSFQRLIHPVLPAIVGSLPLNGGTPRLVSAALEALGELARAAGASLQPWVNEVCPKILETLQDQSSSSKQRTSLRTLAQIAGSTGYVIRPYIDYPSLLSQATSILPGTKRAPWSLRREVIRTLGVLGALDPDRYLAVAPKSTKAGAVGGAYFVVHEDRTYVGHGSEVSVNDSGWVGMGRTPSVPISAGGQTPNRLSSSLPANTTAKKFLPQSVSSSQPQESDDDRPAHLTMYEQYAMVAQPISSLPPARRMTPADEDFYPTVTIQALMRVFNDPSLAVHHVMVIQAIMFIFKSLGIRCVQFLDQVVPHIITTIRTCGPSTLRESLLKQVANLFPLVKEHLRPYVADIFDVVEQFWSSRHLSTIFSLISHIAIGVPDEFKLFLPHLIHLYLSSIEEIQLAEAMRVERPMWHGDQQFRETNRLRLILSSIRGLRRVLKEYLHILVPALLRLADCLIPLSCQDHLNDGALSKSDLVGLSVLALETISSLLACDGTESATKQTTPYWGEKKIKTGGLSSKVVQPLLRLLRQSRGINSAVGLSIVDTICICAKQLGPSTWMNLYDEVVRVAIVDWAFNSGNISLSNGRVSNHDTMNSPEMATKSAIEQYDSVVKDLQSSHMQRSYNNPYIAEVFIAPERQQSLFLNGGEQSALSETTGTTFPNLDTAPDGFDGSGGGQFGNQINQSNRPKINQAQLQRAWDVSQCSSRDDWEEWMRRLGIQLLREAPSPSLRASASLAHAYQPLSRELFSAAFVCCWKELSNVYRVNLVHALETAFVADVSPEILQALLNLAEFMEHDPDGGLPIDIPILADLALRCRSYAKALHYKEREHYMGGSNSCVEALISINRKLDLQEAALGVLKSASARLQEERVSSSGATIASFNSIEQPQSHFVHELYYSVISKTEEKLPPSLMEEQDVAVEKERWLAKLGSWTDALEMYEDKLMKNPRDFDAAVGCMRCLSASGEWGRVLDLAEDNWPTLSTGQTFLDGGYDAVVPSQNTVRVGSRDQRKALRMCAEAAWRLGRWDDLEKYSSELVHGHGANHTTTARSTHGTRQRDSVPRVDYEGAFYSAILHVHREEWRMAAEAIDAARRAMDGRFTALMAESYSRAYPSMVTAQTLAELEEIIEFQKTAKTSTKNVNNGLDTRKPDVDKARERLLTVWRDRLEGCRVDADVHSSILAVRSLVVGPTDEVDSTLILSELSRQAQRFKLAERVLLDPLDKLGADLNGPAFGFGLSENLGLRSEFHELLQTVPTQQVIDNLTTSVDVSYLPAYGPAHYQWSQKLVQDAGGIERLSIQHKLYFAFLKHLWFTDRRDDALQRLDRLCDVVDMVSHCEPTCDYSLRSACWLELGEWKLEGKSAPNSSIPVHLQVEVLAEFKRATIMDGNYKAWHNWALLNFRIAQQMNAIDESSERRRRGTGAVPISQRNHVVAAITSFVTAISIGTKRWSASVQQDMLNFLACLFKYGDQPAIASVINKCIESVPIETWLGVLPQLLARIHIRNPSIRSVLHPLLVRLGEKHPQALMYPLAVLLKSPVGERKRAAEVLMNSLRSHSSALVEEALMVSSELIRVAILWLETWHEGLEEASRLYFGEGNVSGMLDLLIPLHEQIEQGAETNRENEFIKVFGEDLLQAHRHLKDYARLITECGDTIPTGIGPGSNDATGQHIRQNEEAETELNKAWDIYYTVFRRINKQFPALVKLELGDCSPALSQLRSLELGIPGSYRVDGSYIKIEKFIHTVQVINSKQRPRKITLRGSDGKDYVFLLKGHEDLRQDERVIQLFGLVNALLERDRQTRKQDLRIQRYAVCPLSHNCGLVGWVPQTATLHALIRDYRQSKRIPLNLEHREMLKIAPNYDELTVMQKVEVFTEALKKTTGQGNDLYEILWLKSTNSEEWLERRTKYTRSLAVMSMVGYILGLGDRHPSNIMLDKTSGKLLQIDFGDCFEVAMNREKFPETVGFRLTRMLIKAMEVSGIEGSYRSTCERTMTVLRENRDSLVAMLEAFVYDPLMSWRLVDISDDMPGDDNQNIRSGIQSVLRSGMNPLVEDIGVGDVDSGVPIEAISDTSDNGFGVGPISEGENEDDDGVADGEDRDNFELGHGGTVPGGFGRRDRTASIPIRSNRYNPREAAMSASRARSLQMYANIQTWAANTADDGQLAVSGSMTRSRMERSMRQKELQSILDSENSDAAEEALNEKALKVIRRVQDKLSGTDFPDRHENGVPLAVEDQVQRLIVQATSVENLCQLFIGWCAFW